MNVEAIEQHFSAAEMDWVMKIQEAILKAMAETLAEVEASCGEGSK